ncbi:hypothetical protein [Algoriphagus persicinus]|uniref:hypothetical protein n=1 Tax=Algoriphagus persicinus TaxID=3108754 RepID=UPI002B3A3330|nr:hypothetical protein [Algoriphagus sp. E1-3-M2]MEB2787097.1 hypothetical protein [Algoriphagus sp. E1-3-M2]
MQYVRTQSHPSGQGIVDGFSHRTLGSVPVLVLLQPFLQPVQNETGVFLSFPGPFLDLSSAVPARTAAAFHPAHSWPAFHHPHKRWKYTKEDELIPKQWDDYRKAYHSILNACDQNPWHIIPSDKRWFRNYTAAQILTEQLTNLNLKYPGE